MSSDEMSERILRVIQARSYQPLTKGDLARMMRITSDEKKIFLAVCKALLKVERMVLGSGQTVMLPPPPGTVVGTYRSNPRGFGFVIPDEPKKHDDLYVRASETNGAMTGDTVKARVVKRGKRDGKMLYEGRIVSILQRGQNRFVGELRHKGRRWFLVPDGKTMHLPIGVGDPGAKGAKPGDQVVVEITRYPSEQNHASGVIVKILGQSGEPDVDTQSIIEQYQLVDEFDEAVLKNTREAIRAYNPEKCIDQREDLRKLTIITIDPVDARDFDDAISLTQNDDNTFELGVHIADVAYFVREGTALDDEARKRATSVYLPRKVIPMLPEILSNGVCSLQEHEDRLTKSVFITYDSKAKILNVRYVNSIIRSTKRLTYEQATEIFQGKVGRVSATVVTIIKAMEKLARKIQKRRLKDGMLELDLPEIELVYNKIGMAVDVRPVDTSFSHKMIEMFMVEANEAVIRLFAKLNVPCLRRIHDDPEGLTTGSLHRFLLALGYRLPEQADRFDLQQLLNKSRGKDESFSVHLAVLRSMSEAEYSPRMIGHFALASRDYGHFTSPIRRYPDLTIHRLLDEYHAGRLKKKAGVQEVPDVSQLLELGNHCNDLSRQAEAAERELKLVLILRILQERIGDVFDGIVTGVTNMGIFVQLSYYLVDGLIRFEQLSDDWWELDAGGSAVVGSTTGVRIAIGHRLKVFPTHVDISSRRMELALSEPIKSRDKRSKGAPRKLVVSNRSSSKKSKRSAGRGRSVRKKSSRRDSRRK